MYVQEAKQALELMGKWVMIDVSDALELLSPVFESEEVRVCFGASISFLTLFMNGYIRIHALTYGY